MDFDYKKYSLEKLEEWMHDAMSSDASPHEIYFTIREVVRENYNYHKEHVSRAYGLLELLSGHRPVENKELLKAVLAEKEYYEGTSNPLSCDKDDPSPECKEAWNDFWEQSFQSNNFDHPEDYEQFKKEQQLDPELEAIKAAGGYEWTPPVDEGKSKYYYEYDRNDVNRENPFNEEKGGTLTYDEAVSAGWKMTDDGFWIKDKVKKWILPVQVDGLSGDCFVNFPDDLLEAANLKEGDQVEWVDQGNGSYLLRKVNPPAWHPV